MSSAASRARDVLRVLATRHNVLISGAPGTGKSRLLSEVAASFVLATKKSGPVVVPSAKVPLPAAIAAPGDWQPSPHRSDRRVFSTVFHQNTKHRDFVSGIVPSIGAAGAAMSFRVQQGVLYEAAEHARRKDGASLLIVDEINRGPAVQVFGGALVAMESDKRLAPDGNRQSTTQAFDVLRSDGSYGPFELPHDLYILGAMNQADTSVEPLDVAFLRRWTPFHLVPDAGVLETHFGVTSSKAAAAPDTAANVYETTIAAWLAVNGRIAIGRGHEYQIGHGVFMTGPPPASAEDALDYVRPGWEVIRAHVDEVFFGDLRGVAAALNVGAPDHPLKLLTHMFADQPRLELSGTVSSREELFRLLRAVAA